MPGLTIARAGDVRRCRDAVLVEWAAVAGGQPRGSGANVFELDEHNRITAVIGFWNPQPAQGGAA